MNPRVATAGGCIAAVLALSGCKSNIDQQLLERELRLQEDQIYQLQDELVSRQAQLQRAEGENASLKKQLGFVDADASLPKRFELPPGVAAPARSLADGAPFTLPAPAVTIPDRPMLVPPPVVVPPAGPSTSPGTGGLRFGPPSSPPGAVPPSAIPGRMAPPALDGVPPLPGSPAAGSGTGIPGSSGGDRASLPPIRRLSHEETIAAQGSIAGLVINPAHTVCIDRDGDGASEGVNLVIEPRDVAGRLVAAGGEVTIAVYDESAAPPVVPAGGDAATTAEATATLPPPEACLARFSVTEAEANGHFRGTSRARGLHFSFPWPGRVPQADHVRVLVTLRTADGRSFTADALVATR